MDCSKVDASNGANIQSRRVSSFDYLPIACENGMAGCGNDLRRSRSVSVTSALLKEDLKSCILLPKEDDSEKLVSIKKSKSVHFADSLGRPLKCTRVIGTSRELPLYGEFKSMSLLSAHERFYEPKTQYNESSRKNVQRSMRLLNFDQPVDALDMTEKIRDRQVFLESIEFDASGAVSGRILVRNIAYEKHVSLLYTLDSWANTKTKRAQYMGCSSAKDFDIFSFDIIALGLSSANAQLEFAIKFETVGNQYWDNNEGKNYKVFLPKIEKQEYRADCLHSKEEFILGSSNFVSW